MSPISSKKTFCAVSIFIQSLSSAYHFPVLRKEVKIEISPKLIFDKNNPKASRGKKLNECKSVILLGRLQ
jgi:hypothetical protein